MSSSPATIPSQCNRNRQIWPRKLSRHAQRPWLRCKRCGHHLVQADVHDGATRLQIGRAWSDGDVPLYCPHCGQGRKFVSHRIG